MIFNFKSWSKKHLVEIICNIITFFSKVSITFLLLGLLGGVAYGYSSNRRSDLATSATSFAKGNYAICLFQIITKPIKIIRFWDYKITKPIKVVL